MNDLILTLMILIKICIFSDLTKQQVFNDVGEFNEVDISEISCTCQAFLLFHLSQHLFIKILVFITSLTEFIEKTSLNREIKFGIFSLIKTFYKSIKIRRRDGRAV